MESIATATDMDQSSPGWLTIKRLTTATVVSQRERGIDIGAEKAGGGY